MSAHLDERVVDSMELHLQLAKTRSQSKDLTEARAALSRVEAKVAKVETKIIEVEVRIARVEVRVAKAEARA